MPSSSPPPRPIVLAHLTDMHLFARSGDTLLGVDTEASFQGVLQHLIDAGDTPDLVLATGDLSQDGRPESYTRFLDMVTPLGAPVHVLPGNHDVRASFHAMLAAHAVPVIDQGPWRIILLDSTLPDDESGWLAPDQLELLRTAGQVEDGRHVLVAMHHNPVPMHSAWLDPMRIGNADALFTVLDTLPRVRALLWGHVHQAGDSLHDLDPPPGRLPLRMLSTPSTCFQFTPRSVRFSIDPVATGYRWITLHPDGRLDTHVVRVTTLAPGPDHPSHDSTGY